MNVVILAGGRLSEDDPLAQFLPKDGNKALLPLCNQPMIQWVLDAIGKSELVSRVILVGQDENSGFTCKKPMEFLPDHGSLIGNFLAGVKRSVQISPKEEFTLISSGDIPLVTAEMVDWVIRVGMDERADVTYLVVPKEVMEARFPGSNRTFVALRDVKVCGGDLNLIANRVVEQQKDLLSKLEATRKNPLRQAALFGPGILLGVLFRRFTLQDLAVSLGARLRLSARAVLSPYAELGMDIDKMHQYELVRDEVESDQSD